MVRQRLSWDHLAMGLGGLCFAHCLLTPVVLALFPLLAQGVLGSESLHTALLWLTVPVSGLGLWLGCREHKDRAVVAFGLAGMAFLVAARGFEESPPETWLTVAGSLTLIGAHLRNFRLCRAERCEH
ncbi:MerC mercury resistance protein [Calidithermus terrae]|uniref:MerC mercury resistance protein n=1 Tax=Calidithermus terrae TaxID=1408545 RepID=A0A399EFZ0_9DEIN|nr:MerC mercury resistance protein [Calidithermus terrae]